jgi:hypothetical protein
LGLRIVPVMELVVEAMPLKGRKSAEQLVPTD